jgi:hypothetical protein
MPRFSRAPSHGRSRRSTYPVLCLMAAFLFAGAFARAGQVTTGTITVGSDLTCTSFDASGQWDCRPWWKWLPSCATNEKAGLGIDVQTLSVLNQSPGGQRPFFSQDKSFNAVVRNWDYCTKDSRNKDSAGNPAASIAVLHEPALGVTASIHFRDPGDTSNAGQTRSLTMHPLLTAHPMAR